MPAAGWELLDYATVLLEGAFLVAYPSRRAFKLIAAIACLFHFGIAVMMELVFVFNLAAYGAFVDWEGVAVKCGARNAIGRLQRWLLRRTDAELLLAAVAFSIVAIGWTNPLDWLMRRLIPGGVPVAIIAAAAIGSAVFLASQILRVFGRQPGRAAQPRRVT